MDLRSCKEAWVHMHNPNSDILSNYTHWQVKVELDESIVIVVLSPCVDLGDVQIGEQMHSRIIKSKQIRG